MNMEVWFYNLLFTYCSGLILFPAWRCV